MSLPHYFVPFSFDTSVSITAVEFLRDSECGVVAAMALLAFDYCLTFRKEVEWLYGTKWTPARIHFTSSRYLPFVALALAIQHLPYCGFLGIATNVMYYICVALAEAMLIIRTYVFWNCDKRILIGMCTFGVVCLAITIVASKTVLSQPADTVYKNLDCLGVQGTVAATFQYIGLIFYETVILGLNWIAFRRMKRQAAPSQLVTTLYRDGMMYMAAIVLFSAINAVVTLAKSIQYSDILNSPQVVLHSILASRIFFNLREISQQEQGTVLPVTLTEFYAAPQTYEE